MQRQDSNEDNDDSSFELFEPITSMPSANASMSIVAIPDDEFNQNNDKDNVKIINDLKMDMSRVLNGSHMNGSTSEANNLCQTMPMDSVDDNTSSEQSKVRTADGYEPLPQSGNSTFGNITTSDSLSVDMDTCLKEMRDLREENEKLKTTLEKHNEVMRTHIKNVHDWQTRLNRNEASHNKCCEIANEEVLFLKEENRILTDRIKDLEGMAGLKLMEELGVEVVSLRSRLDMAITHEKLCANLQSQNHELSSKLVDAQQSMSLMCHEITSVKRQLSESKAEAECTALLRTQMTTYERDFKLEEMKKLAAIKEIESLEKEVQRLKEINAQMEERLQRGEPKVDISAKEEPAVGKHSSHRKARHMGKLGRRAIPALNAGLVLQGFTQYKTTSKDA